MTLATPAAADFPVLAQENLTYLDSAATAQTARPVIEAMDEYYTEYRASIHRGVYPLAARATDAYEGARERVAAFVGSTPGETVFTRNATEAINLVSYSWGRANVGPGDEIVVTALDHHANFVPWQQLAIEKGATVRVCELTADGRLDLDCMKQLVTSRTKVVAFNHVSNALGTINPVTDIVRLVRDRSTAITVCDGAQSAPHFTVDVDAMGVDFYAFSGHKMLGPMGLGGLVGRRALLEKMPPYQSGGDMIEFVYDDRSTWNVLPHKFEAGTPNAAAAVGLAAAVAYLEQIGMDRVLSHERSLMSLAQTRLSEIEGLRIYGPPVTDRSGVVSFTLEDVHPHDLATILDGEGVCIRAGHHCAQPLMRRLNLTATARASFYVYNDEDDVDALVTGIMKARDIFGYVPA